MENCNEKRPSTPEKMLSESEEENRPQQPPKPYVSQSESESAPAMNMPRIMGPSFGKKTKDHTNESLTALAKGLENNSILKGAFDLEELKRKQADLLLIQEMVQKNIEGIQQQIRKWTVKNSPHRSNKNTFKHPIGHSYYKKFEESDDDSKHSNLTYSNRLSSNLAPSSIKLNDTKMKNSNGSQSPKELNCSSTYKIPKPTGETSLRARSSMGTRRRRSDRKQSTEQNSMKSVEVSSGFKNGKPSSVNNFPNSRARERVKNVTDTTTTETYTNLTKKEGLKRREDSLQKNYSSTHETNYFTQLKGCAKKITLKAVNNLTKISPTLPTVRVVLSLLKVLRLIGENYKTPEDWSQAVNLLLKMDKKILSIIHQIHESIELLNFEK
jgi:hypothetical protein